MVCDSQSEWKHQLHCKLTQNLLILQKVPKRSKQPFKNSKKKLLKENPETEELDREKHKQTQRHQVWGNNKVKLFCIKVRELGFLPDIYLR